MTLPYSQLASDFNRIGAEFLCADLDTALTFTEIAASEDRDAESRQRNRENAHKAYDAMLNLSARIALKPEEKVAVDGKLAALKHALEALGDVF